MTDKKNAAREGGGKDSGEEYLPGQPVWTGSRKRTYGPSTAGSSRQILPASRSVLLVVRSLFIILPPRKRQVIGQAFPDILIIMDFPQYVGIVLFQLPDLRRRTIPALP